MKKCECKGKFTESLKESSAAIWLFAVCSFLFGIIVGFCVSPVKNGFTIGSNNSLIKNFDSEGNECNSDDEDEIKF